MGLSTAVTPTGKDSASLAGSLWRAGVDGVSGTRSPLEGLWGRGVGSSVDNDTEPSGAGVDGDRLRRTGEGSSDAAKSAHSDGDGVGGTGSVTAPGRELETGIGRSSELDRSAAGIVA